jgi:uncharacterized protein YecE (DUF72 family)
LLTEIADLLSELELLEKAARRARREERRARQRLLNVQRAKQMHAIRLASVAHASVAPGEVGKEIAQKTINVGCSGWFYWHWKGTFYPADLTTNRWFGHYAKRFSTVELNAPFYSWPTRGTLDTWQRQAGSKQFVYTVKVSELITHVKRFVGTKTLVADFGYIADVLGRRMGCFLFQLPPSFKYTAARLRRIVDQLEPHRRNVVEFRHRSWWNETVYEAFREKGIIFCSTSGPRLPDELIRTADDIYLRFHGIKQWYRHDYSKAELSAGVTRIQESGARRIWCYFNNDRDGFAIKNARELIRQLRAAGF